MQAALRFFSSTPESVPQTAPCLCLASQGWEEADWKVRAKARLAVASAWAVFSCSHKPNKCLSRVGLLQGAPKRLGHSAHSIRYQGTAMLMSARPVPLKSHHSWRLQCIATVTERRQWNRSSVLSPHTISHRSVSPRVHFPKSAAK